MFNFIINSTRDSYEEHGVATAIIGCIIAIGVAFGCLCGVAALLMVCWNFAVVSAITVCSPIGFWKAVVLILAVNFLLPSNKSNKE